MALKKLALTNAAGYQIRLAYDSSHYADLTTDANGYLNIAPSGGKTVVGTILNVTGTAAGVASFGGVTYSHVLVAFGYEGGGAAGSANPLTDLHQVGAYSAIQGNASCTGAGSYVIGFETACGVNAGANVVDYTLAWSTGSVNKGAGVTITRTIGLSLTEETAGTYNAAISTFNATFAADYFIYYPGTRVSYFGGPMVLPSELYRSSDSSYVRISASNTAGESPSLIMYGSSHATNAFEAHFNAGNGVFTSDALSVGTTLGVTGIATFTTLVSTPASTTGTAGLRIAHGAAPSSPVNGDMWTTTSGLYVRINGATVGPLS